MVESRLSMSESPSTFDIFGYDDYHPGVIIQCTICKDRVMSRIVYCNVCKTTLGHSDCIKYNGCKCSGCNSVLRMHTTKES
jgi:hypothetical protein